MRKDATYSSWAHMKQRCDNPNNHAYEDYGGRDITYDPSWWWYENFLADMGPRPEGTTLDRKDNWKGYNKENCRWATHEEQQNNRRERRVLTQPRVNSKFGIAGVSSSCRSALPDYEAYYQKDRKKHCLYRGKDFFEACCARKSWEIKAIWENM